MVVDAGKSWKKSLATIMKDGPAANWGMFSGGRMTGPAGVSSPKLCSIVFPLQLVSPTQLWDERTKIRGRQTQVHTYTDDS